MRPTFTVCSLWLHAQILLTFVILPRSLDAASPPGERFNVTVGLVVTNGIPGAGAGSLAVAQEQDVYTFSATAGQTLYFRELGASVNIDWALFDSNNQQLFRDRLNNDSHGRVTLTLGGNYELRVFSTADGTFTGPYSFVVLDPQDETFNVPLGTSVTNNIPATGAGRLSIPGQYDIYPVTVSAGQQIYFRDLGAEPNIDWALSDSKSQQIFRDRLDGFSPARVA